MSLLEKLLGKPGKGTVEPEPYKDSNPRRSAVVRQVCGLLLEYPDQELVDLVPSMRAALGEAGADAGPVEELFSWLTTEHLPQVQAEYVQEFDLSKRHSLHLTYWTDGDTRRRGEALAAFKEVYRAHGALPEGSERCRRAASCRTTCLLYWNLPPRFPPLTAMNCCSATGPRWNCSGSRCAMTPWPMPVPWRWCARPCPGSLPRTGKR